MVFSLKATAVGVALFGLFLVVVRAGCVHPQRFVITVLQRSGLLYLYQLDQLIKLPSSGKKVHASSGPPDMVVCNTKLNLKSKILYYFHILISTCSYY